MNLTASCVPFMQGFQMMESLLNCTLKVSTQFQLQKKRQHTISGMSQRHWDDFTTLVRWTLPVRRQLWSIFRWRLQCSHCFLCFEVSFLPHHFLADFLIQHKLLFFINVHVLGVLCVTLDVCMVSTSRWNCGPVWWPPWSEWLSKRQPEATVSCFPVVHTKLHHKCPHPQYQTRDTSQEKLFSQKE